MTSINETAVAISNWIELSILGKATLYLLTGLVAVWLAGRARASVRHLFLTATFAAAFALPLVVLFAPQVSIGVEVPQTHAPIIEAPSTQPAIATSTTSNDDTRAARPAVASWPAISWITIARSVWLCGALMLLFQLGLELCRLRRIRRDGLPWPERDELMRTLAHECGVKRPIELLLHEGILAPLTYGIWRPAVMVPNEGCEWGEDNLRRAIVHELEHVKRGDWMIQLAARLTVVFYWFHPLVWMAFRRLRVEAERACDDAVIRNEEHTEYAEQLILLAGRMSKAQAQPALGMANRSDLSKRVAALLNSNQRRGPAGLVAASSVLSVAVLAVLLVAPVRAVTLSQREIVKKSGVGRPQKKTAKERIASAMDRALFEAAGDGDVSAINELLQSGANVNCTINRDGTPLIAAARAGYLDVVQLLLDRGANPNLSSQGDGNPLIAAAGAGFANIVELLLSRDANINDVVPGDENALINASANGHLDVVKLLVERGADVNVKVPTEELAMFTVLDTKRRTNDRTKEVLDYVVLDNVVKLSDKVMLTVAKPDGGEFKNGEGKNKQPVQKWRTALKMARTNNHQDVVDYLISVGARDE